ncbi:DUF262 domain-containing protein [Gulosibacter sediminis]|uniref:DUF262 domain-containing protein n=1 Tax=Gulosibacter sediminis TaxID=1729695 RepID=UPI0024ADB062|nr:DUF262 domain-containing protein [Gulosibacter sediminis]
MKAVDTNLLQLLKKSERFVVPIYQRVYSWGEAECYQLWRDIVRAGQRTSLNNHFTGSIVYIERDQGSNTSREPDLIIDGQQRVTTVTLLLAALAQRLEELPEDEREPVPGFAPQRIRGLYLTNQYESGDDYFKLILTQRDKDALKSVIRQGTQPDKDSRVVANFNLFLSQLRDPKTNLVEVCHGINKLVVVDVKLTRGLDDPQLVFESMNATGKKLSQADLIRNFVLMDMPTAEQERLYESYWFPMEREFQGANEKRFDEFVRHYLTIKSPSHTIPRIDEIYEAFKAYAFGRELEGVTREQIVVDLSRHVTWFAAMALGKETDMQLARRFAEIEKLATVVYPFQLQVYSDYAAGKLTSAGFAQILDATISYIFRRTVCAIPTNSLNKTFATLVSSIDPDRYVESVCARLLTLPDYRRFPADEEFIEALKTVDMYHIKRRAYFFHKLENHGSKEEASTARYTIEHIMPQNANPAWQTALGEDWQAVHNQYLHTLGNLTLTGYNSEYSDRSFPEKRDMEGGFKHSPLRLNEGIGQLATWGKDQIEQRASSLAFEAVKVWARPELDDRTLSKYQKQFTAGSRFDWSQAHAMLAAMPDGTWTSYEALAEAVGTYPQPMANHLATCTDCSHAYRVLTNNGAVSDRFKWLDPIDTRKPVAVLEAEGIRFVRGKADPEQKLDAETLLELVEEDAA